MTSDDVPLFSADLPLTYRRRTADVGSHTHLGPFSADVPLTYRRPTADVPMTSPPLTGGFSGARWGRPGSTQWGHP